MSLKEAKKEKPKKRRLMGGSTDPLHFDKETGYHYRVFNDDPNRPGRIELAKEAGYEVVISEQSLGEGGVNAASKIGKAVTTLVGAGITGVLMRKPKKWYDEDQKEKQKIVDERESAIKRHSQQPGRYGKIEIGKMTSD